MGDNLHLHTHQGRHLSDERTLRRFRRRQRFRDHPGRLEHAGHIDRYRSVRLRPRVPTPALERSWRHSVHVAEIVEDHAGKTIRMRLFDAGDGAGTNYTLTPLDPTGSPVPTCQYRHYFAYEDPATKPWLPSDDPSVCAVDTKVGGTSLYNDKWVDIDIDIPTTYTCGGYCWWSVDYDTGGAAFYERTVWAVVIIGDPVRLVE